MTYMFHEMNPRLLLVKLSYEHPCINLRSFNCPVIQARSFALNFS